MTTQCLLTKTNEKETMNEPRIAVFASGTGSNLQSMLNEPDVAQHIALLVCDQRGAPVIDIATKHDIKIFVFDVNEFDSKAQYEQKIVEKLQDLQITWIFLAGYMRIVGGELLQAFDQRIVNIHPSYLPEFPGKDAVGQALRAGVQSTGVTVHFVDEGIDTGPIIAQEKVEVLPGDTMDELTARIQQVEHVLYPTIIKQLLGGRL